MSDHTAPDLATFDHSRHMDKAKQTAHRTLTRVKQAAATTIIDGPDLAALAAGHGSAVRAWGRVLDQWEGTVGDPKADMDNGIVHHLIRTRDLDELGRQLHRIAHRKEADA